MGPDEPVPPGYRRRIRLTSSGDRVVADLEDDFHRFRLTMTHDTERIVTLDGEAIRYPWSTCPAASDRLRQLEGTAMSAHSTDIASHDDPRQNCTHLFDLTGLAMAQAVAGRERRQFDAYVPEAVERRTQPQLWLDGDLVLSWHTDGSRILDPPPFAGISMAGGFVKWATTTLAGDTLESAMVLRRAWDIARARGRDLDHMENAVPLAELLPGACFTMQPDIAPAAARMKATARDFSKHPELLLA